jgi:hypothetical protein
VLEFKAGALEKQDYGGGKMPKIGNLADLRKIKESAAERIAVRGEGLTRKADDRKANSRTDLGRAE